MKLIYQATIELEPKTKKNGSRIVLIKGVPRILPSKDFEEYQKGAGFFLDFPEGMEAIRERVNLECKFFRADALAKEKDGAEVNIEGQLKADVSEKDGQKKYFVYVLVQNYGEDQSVMDDDSLPF